MTRQKAQAVILCEDAQQATFAESYLKSRGLTQRQIRTVQCPAGSGSGARFVLAHYPRELELRRQDIVNRGLVVILDEDGQGVAARMRQLARECSGQRVRPRGNKDRVGLFIPKRNIETWLRYLKGQAVNETDDYSPHGPHKPIGCKPHIDRLTALCASGALPPDAPVQLKVACAEVTRVL